MQPFRVAFWIAWRRTTSSRRSRRTCGSISDAPERPKDCPDFAKYPAVGPAWGPTGLLSQCAAGDAQRAAQRLCDRSGQASKPRRQLSGRRRAQVAREQAEELAPSQGHVIRDVVGPGFQLERGDDGRRGVVVAGRGNESVIVSERRPSPGAPGESSRGSRSCRGRRTAKCRRRRVRRDVWLSPDWRQSVAEVRSPDEVMGGRVEGSSDGAPPRQSHLAPRPTINRTSGDLELHPWQGSPSSRWLPSSHCIASRSGRS